LRYPNVTANPAVQPTLNSQSVVHQSKAAAAMGLKDTKMFRKFARKAFDEIDMDKTGRVDYKEVRGLLL
jgi:Ca2+-binding EF-hand superfamily protein